MRAAIDDGDVVDASARVQDDQLGQPRPAAVGATQAAEDDTPVDQGAKWCHVRVDDSGVLNRSVGDDEHVTVPPEDESPTVTRHDGGYPKVVG